MKTIKRAIYLCTMIMATNAVANTTVELYKSPSCGCCTEWANIMEEKGYTVHVHHQNNWNEVKSDFGMPNQLVSCHTAVIDGYMFEGHVPESDIARVLKERPQTLSGLSAPGMPQHSPGMAKPGEEYKDFDVIAFDKDGNMSVYSQY
ncbi:CopG family transcriptional regulator [Vibrio sp. qd031]|uniref:DUF411 domain-containing protein n=1 Tax=Vibrio sp. qd031 TaxID=1603038 RepID=UPI000A1113F2|nr:DUF411 domain-containing protein [Vibrio sp. qd031]ORT48255.1 CopG family transcriptional regulator [Vibrio sp. qd031]